MNDLRIGLLRLIPTGTRGKARLARFLLKGRLTGPILDKFGFRYEAPDLREPIAFDLAVDGVYEPETLAVILGHLSPGDVFVDIGANIGAFTLPAARTVGKTGRVLAAEASAEVFSYLLRNVAANGHSAVITLNCAICDSSGAIPFYPAPNEKFGMGSLGVQFSGKPIAVPAERLDTVLEQTGIEHVDVLKIDVEGFEVSVFRGAQKLLTATRPPLILFEFCDWAEARVPNGQVGDAQRVLIDYGYSLWRLTDFLHGREPLREPLQAGFTMLVAARDHAGGAKATNSMKY